MDDNGNMLPVNDNEWFKELVILKIDRISLLCIVESLELRIRHPDIPPTSKEITRLIGKSLALRLIGDGVILPDNVIESWRKTFGITPAVSS